MLSNFNPYDLEPEFEEMADFFDLENVDLKDFDSIISRFKQEIRKSIKTEIKSEMNHLKKENDRLRPLEQEMRRKTMEAENLQRTLKYEEKRLA